MQAPMGALAGGRTGGLTWPLSAPPAAAMGASGTFSEGGGSNRPSLFRNFGLDWSYSDRSRCPAGLGPATAC